MFFSDYFPRPASLFPLGKPGKPALLAHRGSPAPGVPENSREAFDTCVSSGEAMGLETDIHATRDGYPVISHDPLWHAAGKDIEISTVTWKELSGYRLSNDEPPLGFEEFLERYPSIYLNIDFKTEAVVPQALQILENRPNLDRMALGSFSARRVWAIAERLGSTPGYLPGGLDVVRFLLACESGLMFTDGTKKRISASLAQRFGFISRLLREYNCAFAVPEAFGAIPVVTSRFVAGAHRLGCPVYVWTVNDITQFRRLTYKGVDAVYTDNVHTFRQLNTK